VLNRCAAWRRKPGDVRLHRRQARGSAQLAFCDLERKAYDRLDLEGDHEIGSLTGNLSLDGAPFVHVHAVVADATSSPAPAT
jgi:predicted DNA-binding protein with PD1-like motif